MKLRRPVIIPPTLRLFDQCLQLVGARARGDELGEVSQHFLADHLGAYPSQAEAKAWKRELKSLRPDLLARGA